MHRDVRAGVPPSSGLRRPAERAQAARRGHDEGLRLSAVAGDVVFFFFLHGQPTLIPHAVISKNRLPLPNETNTMLRPDHSSQITRFDRCLSLVSKWSGVGVGVFAGVLNDDWTSPRQSCT